MRKTSFLALSITGALAALLFTSASIAPASHTPQNVHGSPRSAVQDRAPQQSPPVVPAPPLPPIHVDAEPPEIHVEVPEIGPIEVNVNPEEIARGVAEHVSIDHKSFGPIDIDIHHDDRDLNVRAEEKIEKSFTMPAGHRSLEIDNVWGSIEVVGTDSDQVQLALNKSIRAESNAKLELARKEVTLDITEESGSLKLYVNGPFRCHCDDGCGRREFEGYIVKMDFQLRVPRDIDVKLKTVNEGRVLVRNINGSFLVRNVNGDVEMRDMAGSGTAHTVNGPVKVSFRQNPRESSGFKTINGAVELQFTKNLSADFRFKTFNGGIYSDFPVTALPVRPVHEERHGAKVVFHADRYTGVRVNSGGPEILVENLNGDIRILENHE